MYRVRWCKSRGDLSESDSSGAYRETEDANQPSFPGGPDEHHTGGEGVGVYMNVNATPAANCVDERF